MDSIPEPTFFNFLFLAIILILPFPGSYIAYRLARAPQKRGQAMIDMSYLGLLHAEHWEKTINEEYHLRHYFAPLLLTVFLTVVTLSMTHPVIIQTGLYAGILEEWVNIFGPEPPFPTVILMGRFLFWGWLGAYVYALILTLRRFLDYDLNPNVYVFACNRFLLAFVVCSIVGIGLGAYSATARVPLDVNLTTVYIVSFFIGFFPEQGMTWITITAQRALKQQSGVVKEVALAEVDGMSIWQQGRMQQANIENVQNLATADIPNLVVGTPFTLNQIIDWVDQAILLLYSSEAQLTALENAAIRCASDILVIAKTGHLDDLAEASGLKSSELTVLCKVLQSALNIQLICRYRWQSSMDGLMVHEAAQQQLTPAETIEINAEVKV
jgi:hypothetical protein